MRSIRLTAAAAAILSLCATAAPAETFDEQFPAADNPWRAELSDDQSALLEKLTYRHGRIEIPAAQATLEAPEGYYYLDAADAHRVLEEAWGNPPDPYALGMIFPASETPFHDNAWGAILAYDDMGYVSDSDANAIDYDALLDGMKADLRAANPARIKAGYPAVELIGWAVAPHYDRAARKLYWAKEAKFGDATEHTLNYDIRVLGRRGVLVISFVGEMRQLDQINTAMPDVLAMASFQPGSAYSDFDPDLDTVAAVGIGGLIAGKVLSKTGLIAGLLIFLKKFWFIVLAPFIWLGRTLRGRD